MLKRILFLFAIAFSVINLNAQVTTSSITGSVKDEKGQALTGATITATHLPSGTVYTTIAGKSGAFVLPSCRVGGPYQVKVEFVGLKPAVFEGITLILGEPYNINADMSISNQVMENVVVTGTRRKAAVDKTGASTNINNRQISTLPTISRSITDFTRLTPQANGNSFAGRDGRYNNLQVDGANLNNNFGLSTDPLPGGNSQPISLDAIEEVSVNVSPFDVRQGYFTGAGISAITRSGDNTYKGSIYGYYRDQSYNGTKVGKQTLPAQAISKNKSYGARLGGPIIKNKLFFFISYEKEDRSFPGIPFRPTQPGLTGTNVSAAPIDSLRKFSNFLQSEYGYETGAYDNFPNFGIKNHKALGRIDWNVNKSNKVVLKYSEMVGTEDQQLNATSIPNGGISGGLSPLTSLSRLNNSRFGVNSMAFANSNYGFENTVRSGAIEINSKIGKKASNQLIGTYTKIQSTRIFNGGIFPTIDIMNNPVSSNQNYMHAGMDPFTNNNDVINKIWNLTENFSVYAGKHTITAGASYEHQLVGNMFMSGSNSYYLFNSLNDFINKKAPVYYAYTYSVIPDKPRIYSAELKIGQLGIYIQDEVNINSRFKLSYGVRIDRPVYDEQPLSNPLIAALSLPDKFGKATNYTTGSFPKVINYWSPRAGFRWDIFGDKSLVFRGGTGIFTGRIPFVWLTNIPTNAGMYQNAVSVFNTAANPTATSGYLFDPNPDKYRANFPNAAGSTIPVNFVVTNPNFKFPQVWRSNLAMDKALGHGYSMSLEAIYTRDLNGVWMRNANLIAPNSTAVGADQRPRYTGSNKLYSNLTSAIVLENTNKGGGFLFTAQLNKAFNKGLYGSIAYTYSQVTDVTTNPGSQASSVWNSNPTKRTQNDLELAYSGYAVPHRFVGSLSYRWEYLKKFATTLSFFYEGAAGGRVSYTISGDMNGDGNNSTDLMYIAKYSTDVIFGANTTINGVVYTPAQQWDILNQFIENSPYLRRHRGQYAERNGANTPFFHRLDAKLLQDIFTNIGKHRHTIQFSVDMLNFPNLLNKEWGTRKSIVTSQPLVFVNYNGSGQPTYRINSANNRPVTNPFQDLLSTSSTWGMQLGLRYIF